MKIEWMSRIWFNFLAKYQKLWLLRFWYFYRTHIQPGKNEAENATHIYEPIKSQACVLFELSTGVWNRTGWIEITVYGLSSTVYGFRVQFEKHFCFRSI